MKPEPLVASEVDLRDFGYMPLDVLRLRDSDMATLATGDEFKAAVLLWCAAWHQVPAASLPSDDRLLARYSGAGAKWKNLKAEALRGFVECSDGRLYHPTVAEKALEAFAAKAAQRARTKAATDAREAKRREQQAQRDVEREQPTDVERDVEREQPTDVDQGKGREGKGIEEKETSLLSQAPARPLAEAVALTLVEAPKTPPKRSAPDCPHLDVLALWAEVLPEMPRHLPSQWRGARSARLRARWRETAAEKGWATPDDGLAYLRKLFSYVGQSAFLTGRSPPRNGARAPFVVELEWLVNPSNWAKTLEGKYHPQEATA